MGIPDTNSNDTSSSGDRNEEDATGHGVDLSLTTDAVNKEKDGTFNGIKFNIAERGGPFLPPNILRIIISNCFCLFNAFIHYLHRCATTGG